MGLVDWASPSPGISPRLARIHPSYDLAHPGAAATEAPHGPRGTALLRDWVCVPQTAAHGVVYHVCSKRSPQ